jgi:peptidoglycan/xylan/chitin deacetylase (PgdA/CDA1 family)
MKLNIVTYHYIDDPKKYTGGIYPVSPEDFEKQLEILGKSHTFISEKDLVDAIADKKNLPEKACLVTFDDGLSVQYQHAVPTLKKKKIPAVFFISTQPHSEGKATVVHKIHYLLSARKPEELLSELLSLYKEKTGRSLDWESVDVQKIRSWYIYDDEETGKFKYLLNHLLPPNLSREITEQIFINFYQRTEKDFCNDLYLKKEEIANIRDEEFFAIGLHSHTHMDISKFSTDDVVLDFKKNLNVLKEKFSVKNVYGLSYPYGITDSESDSKKVSTVAKELGLLYGVTTERGVNRNLKNPLVLKRLRPDDLSLG